jgi:glucokinase
MALIGIDLGGTKIQAVALDGTEVVADARSRTPVQGGPLAVVDAIGQLVAKVAGEVAPEAVGVGAPGVVDPSTGTVVRAPNLRGWVEPFTLGPALADALGGVPVAVDNDVNVGLLAEHRSGAAAGTDDVLGVFVGTGVGGALILDGELRHGPRGGAGEIGHVVVVRNGRRCGCGQRGHLEAYAGRAAMERRARALDERGRQTVLVELATARRMTSSVFSRALAAGDAVAVRLIEDAVAALATAIASAAVLLDISLVVVGGGLADRLGPKFVRRVEQAAAGELFLPDASLRVVPAALGDLGGAIGAALVAGQAAGR